MQCSAAKRNVMCEQMLVKCAADEMNDTMTGQVSVNERRRRPPLSLLP